MPPMNPMRALQITTSRNDNSVMDSVSTAVGMEIDSVSIPPKSPAIESAN